MTFKLLASLAGAAAIALVAFSNPAHADQAGPFGPQIQQALARLDLSEDQQEELRQIFRESRSDLENVLTEDQREQLQEELSSGVPLRQAIASLDLSEDQRDEAWEIMRSSRQDMNDVLTDEQRAELRQMLRSRFGDRARPNER